MNSQTLLSWITSLSYIFLLGATVLILCLSKAARKILTPNPVTGSYWISNSVPTLICNLICVKNQNLYILWSFSLWMKQAWSPDSRKTVLSAILTDSNSYPSSATGHAILDNPQHVVCGRGNSRSGWRSNRHTSVDSSPIRRCSVQPWLFQHQKSLALRIGVCHEWSVCQHHLYFVGHDILSRIPEGNPELLTVCEWGWGPQDGRGGSCRWVRRGEGLDAQFCWEVHRWIGLVEAVVLMTVASGD